MILDRNYFLHKNNESEEGKPVFLDLCYASCCPLGCLEDPSSLNHLLLDQDLQNPPEIKHELYLQTVKKKKKTLN